MKFVDVKKIIRILKRLYLLFLGKEKLFKRQLSIEIERHGTKEGGWYIHDSPLNSDSVIYSFGIGEDISCELSIIEKFGPNIFAFDPTPLSIRWLQSQELPDNFHFYDIGLAHYDGAGQFFPPDNPKFVSHTMLPGIYKSLQTENVSVNRLKTIMEKLQHSKIDILKLDIEGSEYEVLEDILKCNLDIHQILIEFHHRFPNLTVKMTEDAITNLNGKGYKIYYSSIRSDEYGFIRNF